MKVSDRLPNDSNPKAALKRLRDYIASDNPDSDETIRQMGVSAFVLAAIYDVCCLEVDYILREDAVEVIMELCILHERACQHRNEVRNTLWDQVVQARAERQQKRETDNLTKRYHDDLANMRRTAAMLLSGDEKVIVERTPITAEIPVVTKDPNRNPYNQPPYRDNAGESL
jgi:hypothetical protein